MVARRDADPGGARRAAGHLAEDAVARAERGEGESFHRFINGLRVRAVQRELEDPASNRDLLQVALDAGFSAKASFNRVFKSVTGMTPSTYREMARSGGLNSGQTVATAGGETHAGLE